jgi:hypothetical protein
MGFMSNQRTREDRVVTIATALAVMLGTFLLGVLGMLAVGTLTDMSQTFNAATMWVAITALGIGIGYLIHTGD